MAPHLSDLPLFALDYHGVGYSSWYPDGVLPYWKNDAFLLLQVIKEWGWKKFDIVAHSLGSLLATIIAIALPEQVGKLVFLDVLGPTVNFTEQGIRYLKNSAETYLTPNQYKRNVFPDQACAIHDRMKMGNLSYNAARALVERGTIMHQDGLQWTCDSRLHCVGATVPYEDELRAMFHAIEAPVCLIRAKHGLQYPDDIFQARAKAIKHLVIHEVEAGHHVHMDDPLPVAKLINQFLIGLTI